MADYGITPQGFVIKDLQTILLEEENDLRFAFGDDIDLSATSIFGQLAGNNTKKVSSLWELAQTIYNNFNPDKAENVSLDGASALVGTIRLAATSSNSIVVLYGDIGTIIPIGHLIRQDESNENFELNEEVIISLSNVIDIDFSILNLLDNQLYTITINGNSYDYTSDGTATEIEIIAGLKVSIDLGSESVIVVDNLDGTGKIYTTNDTIPFSISVDSNLQIDNQGSPGFYLSVNKGLIPVPANTLNIIVNPISGLDSVNNIYAGLSGREIETDEELRIRRRELLTGIGAATDEAIRQAGLQEVPNVTSCIVISNRTDITVSGRPPHSFETVIAGGDEQIIANVIWENMPSGIQPYGDITKNVIDSTGRNQIIKFSRPTNIYLWGDIDYYLDIEETFPTNGETAIINAIIIYCRQTFNIGKDVIYQRLSIPIYSIPGVGDIVIRLAVSSTPIGPPGSYTSANIIIADDEVSDWDESRITLNLLP